MMRLENLHSGPASALRTVGPLKLLQSHWPAAAYEYLAKHSSRMTDAADLIGRIALVVTFAAMGTYQIVSFFALLRSSAEFDLLDVTIRLASIAYVSVIVGLTIKRFKPVQSAGGFEPRFSAFVGTFLSVALIALPHPHIGNTLRVTSLVLIAVGWLLSGCVLLWLGRAFSIMAQARGLVRTGPYALVRHPLYFCEEITVLGIALAQLSIAAVLIVAVQWMFQLRRMSNEEKVLGASFPEYATYLVKTPKIIPFMHA